MSAAVLVRPAGGGGEDLRDRCGSGAGFVLSYVQVVVLWELRGTDRERSSADLAAATAGLRSQPVARAVTTLQARHLVQGQAGVRSGWVWSLTPLGHRAIHAMRVLDGAGAVVEVGPSGQTEGRVW
ncbi:hypothetical protein ACTD5D_23195 [Nocardia takedensis]|uniref:hypothetical protein n=1 Tax=Nocardia takedensis TaxID=259390 RepID=UPI003F773120